MAWYKKRSLRTVFLALFATATFVGAALFSFDVDPKLMLQFFILSLLGLGAVIVAALIFTAVRVLISRWLRR